MSKIKYEGTVHNYITISDEEAKRLKETNEKLEHEEKIRKQVRKKQRRYTS